MPEVVIKEQPAQTYAAHIPSFLAPKLPAEFSNEPKPEAKPEPAKADVPAGTPPQEEKEPAETATATPPEVEGQEEGKEPEKETTGKDPDEKRRAAALDRRTSRAIRRAAEERARAELAEKRAAELEAKLNSQTPKAVEGAPKMEDFTDVVEYEKAVRAHERKIATDEYDKKNRQETHSAELRRMSSDWEKQVDEVADEYDDFQEVVGDLKPGVAAWSDAIMLSDNGPKVAHYLGTHQKEAERIIALTPQRQFLEIGKLSVKLAQAPEPKKAPSKAPPPITPVTGTGTPQEAAINDPMPMEQYMKVGAKMFRGR